MTRRIICILLIACAFLGIAQQPAMNEIKQKKQDAQQEINKTSQKIKQNKNKTVKSLNDLNRTTAEIKEGTTSKSFILLCELTSLGKNRGTNRWNGIDK